LEAIMHDSTAEIGSALAPSLNTVEEMREFLAGQAAAIAHRFLLEGGALCAAGCGEDFWPAVDELGSSVAERELDGIVEAMGNDSATRDAGMQLDNIINAVSSDRGKRL
jgi:hypothetical protein